MRIVKRGSYFAWGDAVMRAEEDVKVSPSCIDGECKTFCAIDYDFDVEKSTRLVARMMNERSGRRGND